MAEAEDRSPAEQLALARSEEEREAFVAELTDKQISALRWDWKGFWARPKQLPPPGDWLTWVLRGGRGAGKELKISTEIPTPNGWTTVGDIRPGDELFDEQGRTCRVVKTHPIDLRPEAYRVGFSDGSHIDACADHLWCTWTHRDRKQFLRHGRQTLFPAEWWRHWIDLRQGGLIVGQFGPEIRTTREIRRTLKHAKRGDLNHCIPLALPLQTAAKALPLDPWLLGYWLGNGSAREGAVTAGSYKGDFDDSFVLRRIAAAGFETTHRRDVVGGSTAIRVAGLPTKLAAAGVLNNKHVPAIYLRASVEQRLDLLRGLCDSDGYADQGHIEFTNTNHDIALAVYELVASLSERVVITEKQVQLNGRIIGPAWRVTWRWSLFNPFSLPRKRNRCKAPLAQGLRMRHRMIDAVEPIEPTPMRCLTVDSPSGLFLVGRAMIPTHNTRTGAQWVQARAEATPHWIALVARTPADAREYMIEGPGGILRHAPPDMRPLYEPSKRRLTWPNDSWATIFSDEEPDQLRGFSGASAWLDEFGKYKNPRETWDNLQFGLRETGTDLPRCLITTTPRPLTILREIEKEASTVVVVGSSYENRSNLDPSWFRRIISRYEGTRIGRQEIHAEILTDVPGALWTLAQIDANRLDRRKEKLPDMQRVVVGVDPAVAHVATLDDESSDHAETGIVVVGLGVDGIAYVLDDLSCRLEPAGWARRALSGYDQYMGDAIVAETNQGGAMVTATIHAIRKVKVIEVHASRGKITRAEPISALYEQGRVRHVGTFPELEDQMTSFTNFGISGDTTADRVDAMCLAGGTMVETKNGPTPIEGVLVGDEVLTRQGYQLVEWAGMTHAKARLRAVELSDGTVLRGTKEHPVFVLGKGFVDIDALVCGDTLFPAWVLQQNWSSTARSIADHRARRASRSVTIISRGTSAPIIAICGKNILARYRLVVTSITSTKTPLITQLRTWSAFLQRNMLPGTLATSPCSASISQQSGILPYSGIAPPQGARGIKNTGKSRGPGECETSPSSAQTAGSTARASFLRQVIDIVLESVAGRQRIKIIATKLRFFAQSVASFFIGIVTGRYQKRAPVSVVRVYESGEEPVWNLQVANANEFFANGVLVHNCWAASQLFPLMVRKPSRDRDVVVEGLANYRPHTGWQS